MSPRGLAASFISAALCLWLTGGLVIYLGTGSATCSTVGIGVLMISAISLGTGLGILMQESHEDDRRRAEAAEDQLCAASRDDHGAIDIRPMLGYAAYPPYAESGSGRTYARLRVEEPFDWERQYLDERGEQLRAALDHDTDTFRRIIKP